MRVTVEDLEKLGAKPRDEVLLALDEALTRLEAADPRASLVVELRFFGGMEWKQIVEVTGTSLAAVKRDWAFAKSWLYSQLESGCGG